MTIAFDPSEIGSVLKVLLAVARADGTVDDEERSALEFIGRRAGVEPGDDLDVDLDAELRGIRSPAARALTLRAALAIAAIDGRCSPEEHSLLERVHAAFGTEVGAGTLVETEEQWLSRMDGARASVARATEDFLRALSRSGPSLDSVTYEQLLATLEIRKRRALEEAMASPG
jgi:tellurite resistance protein